MPFWQFFDCLSESRQRNLIREWVNDQPQGTRQRLKAALNVRLMELEQVEGPFDRAHGVGQLRGEPCKGLYEIILKVDKIQFRVISCYGPKPQGEFTLLMGTTEKGGRFTDQNVCPISHQRRIRSQDRRFITEHTYD